MQFSPYPYSLMWMAIAAETTFVDLITVTGENQQEATTANQDEEQLGTTAQSSLTASVQGQFRPAIACP